MWRSPNWASVYLHNAVNQQTGETALSRNRRFAAAPLKWGIGSMENRNAPLGFIGIGIGAIALLVAIVHFWAGPFSPQPTLETTVAEKAVAIKNATVAALKGEKPERKVLPSDIDLDKGLSIATGVLGGSAIILGVVGFAKGEPLRVGGGAAVLGGSAVAFQFAVVAVAALVGAILIAAVISVIGIE
jgi:hypothetical protein